MIICICLIDALLLPLLARSPMGGWLSDYKSSFCGLHLGITRLQKCFYDSKKNGIFYAFKKLILFCNTILGRHCILFKFLQYYIWNILFEFVVILLSISSSSKNC